MSDLPAGVERPKLDRTKPYTEVAPTVEMTAPTSFAPKLDAQGVAPKLDRSKPFTEVSPTPEKGTLERLWDGMLGKDASRVGRVGMGMADPVVGAAQLGTRIGREAMGVIGLPKADPGPIDRGVQSREDSYQAERARGAGVPQDKLGVDWYRMLGNVGGTAPLGAAGGVAAKGVGLAGRLGQAALGGAVGGAVEPVAGAPNAPKGDFWTEKAKQAGVGAAGGLVLGGALEGVGAAIAPRLGGDAAALAARGVQMTPGQRAGGMAKSGEDIAQSFPLLGHFINNARTRSFETFNQATINQALEPIGASLPKGVVSGNDAVSAAAKMISKEYSDVLGRIPSVVRDPDLMKAINQVSVDAQKNPDVWRKFRPILRSDVTDPFTSGMSPLKNGVTGPRLKQMETELNYQARGFLKTDDFDRQELGRRLLDLKSALMNAVERQHPAEAPNLQNANSSWAMLTRIEQAAGRRKTSDGLFTPNDLLQASAAQAGGVRRGGVAREFAHGDALFQRWGQTAQRVLPSKIPDSGTAGRLMAADIAGGLAGVGGLLKSPAATLGALGGLGAAAVPYLPPVNRALQGMGGSLEGIGAGLAPGVGAAAATKRKPLKRSSGAE